MTQNNLKYCIGKTTRPKRRAVSEIIGSLLLVVITVAGAILLMNFLDESFVSGSMAVSSSTDSTVKTLKLRAYDTRDGNNLMGYLGLGDSNPTDNILCRETCIGSSNTHPNLGGSGIIVVQIENRSVNPIFLKNIYLDNISHVWDSSTSGKLLDPATGNPGSGNFPADGKFSILSNDINDLNQGNDNQIQNGETVNVLVKLDTINPDIQLSKTIRVQLNIGANSLAEFLVESGDAR